MGPVPSGMPCLSLGGPPTATDTNALLCCGCASSQRGVAGRQPCHFFYFSLLNVPVVSVIFTHTFTGLRLLSVNVSQPTVMEQKY